MLVYIGNECFDFDEDDLEYMYIDEGDEALVYRHGMQALKIYRDYCYKPKLDESNTKKLTNIKTKRILMPRCPIYVGTKNNFKGYTTEPFIYALPKKQIKNMPIDSFLSEIDLFKEDAYTLAENKFEIDDLYLDNIVYNGKLYMVDPGSFEEVNLSTSEIFRRNVVEINELVKDELFSLVKVPKKGRVKINEYFDEFEYIGDAIKDSFSYGESVNRYVKKMVREFYYNI